MTILSAPFRPFFLLGALVAASAVPVWLLTMFGYLPGPQTFEPLRWHVHEMLFGFLAAVLTGFLFTAIPNWTRRLPLQGLPLLALVLLWLAGRIVLYLPIPDLVALLVDGAFLTVVALLAWREVLAGRNWRNTPICVMVSLFAAANILFHLNQTEGMGERLALGVAAVLIALVGGRAVPSFTRNWLSKQSAPNLPVPFGNFDKVCVVLLALAVLQWVAWPVDWLSGFGLLVAGVLHGVRLSRWQGQATLREPMVVILHLGYLWLVLALVLMGCAVLWPQFGHHVSAVHGLGAGAVGTMTLAIMTRASLGHGGRELHAGPATVAIYALVISGAAARVLAPALPMDYASALYLAAGMWSGAFLLFVLFYGPMLVLPARK